MMHADTHAGKSEPPVISVIIPTYNGIGRLGPCLNALMLQDLDRVLFEIIVVDDGSLVDPLSDEEMRKWESGIRIISQENQGPASARNRGAAAAQGKYLAFTDDDCRPDHEWLARMLSVLEERPTDLVGGCTINALNANIYSRASQLLIDYLYTYYDGRRSRTRFFTSNNLALAKNTFFEAGTFSEEYILAAGEDRDFTDRWHSQGRPSTHVTDAVIFHFHSLNFRTFSRQHFNYGRGAFIYRKHRRKHEPIAFYVNLIRFFARDGQPDRIPITLLGIWSQVMNVAGALYAITRSRFA